MIVDEFLDWAERFDGPAEKQYAQPNSGIGIACHSVVGNLPGHTIPGRFFDPNDQASVMFVLFKDGHVIQMYPVTSSTWTSGSFAANVGYWAIEAEGGGAPDYGEKLTPEAEESFIRIVTEWENHTGRKGIPNENILQHKQLVAKYGGGATACASDRYSNAWTRISAGERYGDEVTREEYETLMLAVFSGAEEATLPREERLTNAIYRADQRAQGLASSVADQSASAITIVQEHVLNHAAGVTGPVAPHQHEIAATTIGVVK